MDVTSSGAKNAKANGPGFGDHVLVSAGPGSFAVVLGGTYT